MPIAIHRPPESALFDEPELVARMNRGPLPEGWKIYRGWWRDKHWDWDMDECQSPTLADAEVYFREVDNLGPWVRLLVSDVTR